MNEYTPISYTPKPPRPEYDATQRALLMLLDAADTELSLQDKLRSIVSPAKADDLVVRYLRERRKPVQADRRRRVYLRIAVAELASKPTAIQRLAGDI